MLKWRFTYIFLFTFIFVAALDIKAQYLPAPPYQNPYGTSLGYSSPYQTYNPYMSRPPYQLYPMSYPGYPQMGAYPYYPTGNPFMPGTKPSLGRGLGIGLLVGGGVLAAGLAYNYFNSRSEDRYRSSYRGSYSDRRSYAWESDPNRYPSTRTEADFCTSCYERNTVVPQADHLRDISLATTYTSDGIVLDQRRTVVDRGTGRVIVDGLTTTGIQAGANRNRNAIDFGAAVADYSRSPGVTTALSRLIAWDTGSFTNGKCWGYVKRALIAGNLYTELGGTESSIAAIPNFLRQGYRNLVNPVHNPPITHPDQAPRGAILIYESGRPCRNASSRQGQIDCGHVEMKTAASGVGGYISDFSNSNSFLDYRTPVACTPSSSNSSTCTWNRVLGRYTIRSHVSERKLVAVLVKASP